jgi:hypothetical protein
MEKIPTAEEFYQNYIEENNHDSHIDIEEMMIEFAKMHVEAALKEASEKAKIKTDYWTDLGGGEHEESTINKNSIKKSYSLDNIK